MHRSYASNHRRHKCRSARGATHLPSDVLGRVILLMHVGRSVRCGWFTGFGREGIVASPDGYRMGGPGGVALVRSWSRRHAPRPLPRGARDDDHRSPRTVRRLVHDARADPQARRNVGRDARQFRGSRGATLRHGDGDKHASRLIKRKHLAARLRNQQVSGTQHPPGRSPCGVAFEVWASATTSTPWSTSLRPGTCSASSRTGCPTSSARFFSPTPCSSDSCCMPRRAVEDFRVSRGPPRPAVWSACACRACGSPRTNATRPCSRCAWRGPVRRNRMAGSS